MCLRVCCVCMRVKRTNYFCVLLTFENENKQFTNKVKREVPAVQVEQNLVWKRRMLSGLRITRNTSCQYCLCKHCPVLLSSRGAIIVPVGY